MKLNKRSDRQWRRSSESNNDFTDYQPQYPDLQGDFNASYSRLQEVFSTTGSLPDLTRHLPTYYSVIEEIIEGFVEGLLTEFEEFIDGSSGKNMSACIVPARYGTERMRQKLFVVVSGVLVNTSTPNEPAVFVNCGTQLAGDKQLERSSA